mgnify:FL=1
MPPFSGERASLLVTILLVLVSMFLSVLTTAPKASTLTAMEVWVVSCLVCIFDLHILITYITMYTCYCVFIPTQHKITIMYCVYLLCLVTIFTFFCSYRKKHLIQFIYT